MKKTPWRARNRERANALTKAWKLANKEKEESLKLRHKFGIDISEYNKILEMQNYVCAICKMPETVVGRGGKVKKLAVDHCHKTSRVRGLLCSRCNQAIGLLRESTDSALAIINYLNANSENIGVCQNNTQSNKEDFYE